MLKIKDNVDLKELKKFELYETEDGYVDVDDDYDGCNIFIDKENRHIYFCGEWYGCTFELIDIIFDLSQAGLVEKAGE